MPTLEQRKPAATRHVKVQEPPAREPAADDADDLAPSLRRLIDSAMHQHEQQRQEEQLLLQPPPPLQYSQIHASRPPLTRGASSSSNLGSSPPPAHVTGAGRSMHSPLAPSSPTGAALRAPHGPLSPGQQQLPAELQITRLQDQLREAAAARDRAFGQLKTMVSSVEALTSEHSALRARMQAQSASTDEARRVAADQAEKLAASEANRKRDRDAAAMFAERLRAEAQELRKDARLAQQAADAEAAKRRECEVRLEQAAVAHRADADVLRARVEEAAREASAARQERDKAIAALQAFSAREVRDALAQVGWEAVPHLPPFHFPPCCVQARVAVDEMQSAKDFAEAEAAAGRAAVADWSRKCHAAEAAAASRGAALEARISQLQAELQEQVARLSAARDAAEERARSAGAQHALTAKQANTLRLAAALHRVALQPVRQVLRRWWAAGREAATAAAMAADEAQRTSTTRAELGAALSELQDVKDHAARLDTELSATRRRMIDAHSQLEGVNGGAAELLAALGRPCRLATQGLSQSGAPAGPSPLRTTASRSPAPLPGFPRATASLADLAEQSEEDADAGAASETPTARPTLSPLPPTSVQGGPRTGCASAPLVTPEALAAAATYVTHLSSKALQLAGLLPLLADGDSAMRRGKSVAAGGTTGESPAATSLSSPNKRGPGGGVSSSASVPLSDAMQQLLAATTDVCRAVSAPLSHASASGDKGSGGWRVHLSARLSECEVRCEALDAAAEAERRRLGVAESCLESLHRLHSPHPTQGARGGKTGRTTTSDEHDFARGSAPASPLVLTASEGRLLETQVRQAHAAAAHGSRWINCVPRLPSLAGTARRCATQPRAR